MKEINYCILLLFGFIVCVVNTEPVRSKRSNYGESCSAIIKCNKSLWLNCGEDGICGCAKPNEMMYDVGKNKCVSKAGERCKFEIDEMVVTNSDSLFKLYEKAECVANGHCGADGTCICDKTYFEAINGNCVPKGNYKEVCNSNDECRDDNFLTCINNQCDCNSSMSEYSSLKEQCIGLGGQTCLNKLCAENAECNNYTNICNCYPANEFYQDKSGKCLRKKNYGSLCSQNSECLSENIFLTCENGICDCDESKSFQYVNFTLQVLNSKYDYDKYHCRRNRDYYFNNGHTFCEKYIDETRIRFECVGKVNNACNGNQKCVENSFCGSGSYCECSSSFIATSNGFCGLGYDQECDNWKKFCSDELICSQGKCACKHSFHQTLSATSHKCLSIVSGPCSTNDDCIENTICQINKNTNNGVCECKDGFITNTEGKCELANGSSCNYNQGPSCDKFASLQCRNGICSCPDQLLRYDDKLTKCVGLVGSRCSIIEQVLEETVCVENAKCVTRRASSRFSGSCQCLNGFEESTNRECIITVNQSTSTITDSDLTSTTVQPSTTTTLKEELSLLGLQVPQTTEKSFDTTKLNGFVTKFNSDENEIEEEAEEEEYDEDDSRPRR